MGERAESIENIQSRTISQRRIPSLNLKPIDFKNKFDDHEVISSEMAPESIVNDLKNSEVMEYEKIQSINENQIPKLESSSNKNNLLVSEESNKIDTERETKPLNKKLNDLDKKKDIKDKSKPSSINIESPRRDSIISKFWDKIARRGSVQSNEENINAIASKSRFQNKKTDLKRLPTIKKDGNQPPNQISGFGGLLSVIRKARLLGLWNKTHIYQDFLTREQLFMIKDLAAGKYDKKEIERSKQLNKKKLNITKYIRKEDKKTNKSIIVAVNQSKLKTFFQRVIGLIKETLLYIASQICTIIAPDNRFRIGWDFGLMLLILYDLIMVPLRLSFDLEVPFGITIWEMIIDTLFIMDIFTNFQTGYYEKGLLVMDRKSIAKHYLSGFFLFDVVSSFPYSYIELVFEESTTTNLLKTLRFVRFMRLIRFVRVLKLKKIFSKIESYIDFTPAVTSLIGFFKLSLTILFIAHFIACFWHLTASLEYSNSRVTWLAINNFQDLPWHQKYIISIYWATTTMITVGYGDITPVTTPERIFAIVTMITASGVFAYTMNRINYLLSGLDTASETYKHALASITNYMKKKHVRKELQIKIKKYLEYALEVETSIDSNEAYLNTFLNNSLKAELIEEIHGNFLYNSNIFILFDHAMLARLAHKVQEIFYSPEDTIFLDNDIRDIGIYFVNSGKVEIFNLASNALLKRGSHFGEVSFFTGLPRTASARSVDFSSLYFITQEDFLELLESYPYEKEKFCEIRDKLLFGNQYEIINMSCYSCDEKGHLVKDCPKIHLNVDKKEFMTAYLTKRSQFYKNFIRKRNKEKRYTGRYQRILQAANEIQEKIYEGKLKIDKILLPDYMQEENSQDLSRGSFINRVPSIDKQPPKEKFSAEIPKTKLERSSTNAEFNFVTKRFESKSMMENPVNPINLKKQIESPFESGFDRVCNFKYYFTDYNFNNLFPAEELKTIIFDYGVEIYSESTKKNLIKFIEILKGKIQAKKKKEEELKESEEIKMDSMNSISSPTKKTVKQSTQNKLRNNETPSLQASPNLTPSNQNETKQLPSNQPVFIRLGSANRIGTLNGMKYGQKIGSRNNFL